MSLFLDTHVVLWWLTGSPDLPDDVLIAQARCEGLTLVTRDPQIHRYDGVALLHV